MKYQLRLYQNIVCQNIVPTHELLSSMNSIHEIGMSGKQSLIYGFRMNIPVSKDIWIIWKKRDSIFSF